MKILGLVFLLMLSSSGWASAQSNFTTASAIMPGCRDIGAGNNATSDRWIQGYCAGVVATVAYASSKCRPKAVTNGQIVSVVVQYVDKLPARMHEDFGDLAREAIEAAWPCRR